MSYELREPTNNLRFVEGKEHRSDTSLPEKTYKILQQQFKVQQGIPGVSSSVSYEYIWVDVPTEKE